MAYFLDSHKAVFFCLAISLLLVFPPKTHADETIITAINLNQQPKGEFFVLLLDDGDFLVRTADLMEMGFSRLPGRQIEVEGETYISLKSMEGVVHRLDENTLTLEITAPPVLLSRTTLDLTPTRRTSVYYPKDNSIFFNYGLDYSAGGDSLAFTGLTVGNELGIRIRDLLFLTDSIYTDTPDDSSFVRLNTSLIYDQREKKRRFIAGDFFASSGELGGRIGMGGMSLSKIYRIDPYFIRYPLFDFSGLLPLPSEVEIYLDGAKLRSERFGPGEFELQNFQSIGGAQTVEIVIRDALGREQRIRSPFYFTDQLLRQGLHEYSYNLGLLRQDFGLESNRYADLAFSAFHRYGFTDYFNMGLRGEGGGGLANLGLESVLKAGQYGLVRLEASGSRKGDEEGSAGLLSYEYQSRKYRGRLSLQSFSEGYRTLDDIADGGRRTKLNFRIGVGYVTPRLGSFALDFTRSEIFGGVDQETVTLSWAKRVWNRSYLNTTLRRIREDSTENEAFLNLTYYFGKDHSMTASYRHEGGADIQVVEARKNIPTGEGTGWDVSGERSESDGSEDYLLDSSIQHNARHVVLRGDYSLGRSKAATTEDLRLAISGSVVYLGDTLGLTRPVTDSFGLVSVGQTEGVRVYVNNQTVGRTDSHGKVIVPNLTSYYENQLSIEDKDIPIEYLMPQVRMTASPPLRSGSCLNFPLQRYVAFTGTLVLDVDGHKQPLSDAEITLSMPTGVIRFWTGGEGEFYFDNEQLEIDFLSQQGCDLPEGPASFIKPGVKKASVKYNGKTFSAELNIPPATEQFVDLGEVTWEAPAEIPATIHPAEELVREPAPQIPSPHEESEAPPTEAREPVVEIPLPEKPAETPEIEIVPEHVVHFPSDRSSPVSEDMPLLESIVQHLLNNPQLEIEIEGHTDLHGSELHNLRLGLERAMTIKKYLTDAGIAEFRITKVVSYGEKRPLCKDSGEECLKRNRRAVLIVARSGNN